MSSLSWNLKGEPFNLEFEDCYFSKEDGFAESQYVFLKGNNLPNNWENKDSFTIAESGFGTGLNLLCVWELFLKCNNKPTTLYYISFDGFPLSLNELKKAHDLFPSLTPLARKLQENYPKNLKEGVYNFRIDSLHISLVFKKAPNALKDFPKDIDAWFLDGFAPSKNPKMWSKKFFEKVAKHSKNGTTLSTFTSASIVRKGLEEVGFKVNKTKGFGRKREMIEAVFKES